MENPNDVDFILVWDANKQTQKLNQELHEVRRIEQGLALKRSIFERNLRKEGLILEHETSPAGLARGINFVKIMAPLEVLERYAEILRLRLPIKQQLENSEDVELHKLEAQLLDSKVKRLEY